MSLLPLLPLFAAAATPQPGACAGLVGQAGDVVVERATAIAPAPQWRVEGGGTYSATPVSVPLCRVEGRIEGQIGFELWLPVANWNGRLLGAGVGGDAGVYNYRDMALRIEQGFATVTTDSGHKASETRWMRRAQARVDYEHRATHLTALAAKALVARFYGQAPNRSYFLGCSGGGRQALKEMQNYPLDYDGVVAGAPGPYMPLQSVRMLWFALEQQKHPAGMLSDDNWALYERAVHQACDAQDGVADGIIARPDQCRFDTRKLLCRPGQGGGCLTAPQRAMLDQIIAPLRDEKGRKLDGGLFAGVRTRPGPPSPLLRAMWADAVYDDPNWDALTFNRTADLARVNALMPELRADRTAISPFVQAGHKAILYQGWQDPSTNAGPTLNYYRALAAANGGMQQLGEAVRLFMVPGMYHCRGGPGADSFGGSGHVPARTDPRQDILWALIQWVEQGDAPQQLVATKFDAGKPVLARPLCPYPLAARYTGAADTSAASSFRCVAD